MAGYNACIYHKSKKRRHKDSKFSAINVQTFYRQKKGLVIILVKPL